MRFESSGLRRFELLVAFLTALLFSGHVLASGVTSPAVTKLAVISQGCLASPLPSPPSSGTVIYTATNNIYSGPKYFQMTFWRATCSDNAANSVILVRVTVPTGQSIEICDGGDGGSIVQNGATLAGAIADSTNPADGANGLASLLCGTISSSTTYAIIPFGANAGSFNDQASFQYFYGDDYANRVTIPAFGATIAITPQTGWWWNPNDVAGRGYSIEVNNGRIFLAAYMYRDDGTPVWCIADEVYTAPGFSGTLFDVNGTQTLNATGTGTTSAGPTSVSISGTFSSATQGALTLTGGPLGSTAKTIPITRFPIDSVSVKAPSSASAPQAGWWYNTNENGVGYFIEQQASQIFMANYLYGADQRDRWYITLNGVLPSGTSGETMTGSLLQVTGGQTLTSGPLAAVSSTVGQVTLQFSSPTSGTITLPSGRVVPIIRFTAF